MAKDPFSKALSYAYRLLSIRERSQRELESRLKEKGYSKDRIDKVILYLKEKGLVDDERFAREWIKDRLAFRPKGAWAIRDELLKKGVRESIIESVFKDKDIGYNEYAVCKALASKKLESLKEKDEFKRKKYIYGYLARRGFSFDIINDIIDNI